MGEGVKEAVVAVMGEGVREEEVEMEVVVVMGEGVREVVVEKEKEVVEVMEVVVMVEGEKEMKKLKVALQVDKHHLDNKNFRHMDFHNIHNCRGRLKDLYKFHCNMLALKRGIIFRHIIRFSIKDL
jgi:hypothetical protein